MMTTLDESLLRWLDEHADALDADADAALAGALHARLAAAGLFRIGVPLASGGDGAGTGAALAAVAALASRSLAAAFVYWAQRAVVACLLAAPNRDLAARLVPPLLDGRLAGAPGLSNAMKFLGGLDRLHVRVTAAGGAARLDGAVAWATNLNAAGGGFVALVVAGDEEGGAALYAVPHDAPGVARAPDLDLLGLRATNTAALQLDGVVLGPQWLLHPQAQTLLPAVRPVFVGMQCGLGLGLARACLDAAARAPGGEQPLLARDSAALRMRIDGTLRRLADGLDDGGLSAQPLALLEARIAMVEMAAAAARIELQALGGRAWLRGRDGGAARRRREADFLPLVTPTLLQLKTELARARA
ncbi:acyl-CoA dehydrogenase family protein [uncultured Massilia sp.]|uniref:acyl-CoA dehydrogenase family protein n=1 Tax=uncultured Massilia sp. TaxID=169973 RepID=UPI0025D37BBB|nr:acyl-CoA dehydrogenase family protein [uncultured Massilia sp.]